MDSDSQYRVMLRNYGTLEEFELQPDAYDFSEELNKDKTASFSFSFDHINEYAEANNTTVMSMFTAVIMEIWIEELNSLGSYQKIFNGVISDFSIKPSPDGAFSFDVKAIDWLGFLGLRIAGVPKTVYTATDAGAIAWDLIDDAQNSDNPYSDLGITMGTITASKNRDRTYRFDNVRDSIIALSNDNLSDGFDFEIDTSKVFNVYYPTKGSDLPSIVFDINSVADFTYRKPLIESLMNKVHVLGDGVNDDVAYRTRTGLVANRTTWKTIEKKINFQGVSDNTTLDDHGDKYLALYQAPISEFTAEHYDGIDDSYSWFDYLVGDTPRVNFPDLDMNLAAKRVIRKDFSMRSDTGIAYIKVFFDKGIKL